MADFHTHVTISSVLGCGYSVAGMMAGVPPSTALVAGGLCGVAGMLPDVDSDSGIPRREAMGFAAAIVPMLLVDRFREMLLTHDQMVLAAAAIYFFVRFAMSRLIGHWSVHRGMWHSIPAVLIFTGLAFLMTSSTGSLGLRYFKAFAVGLGAMSHLILDEVYSVDTRGVVPKFKKSFGTAVKLWGKNGWANFSTYAKLVLVTGAILLEPSVLARLEETNPNLAGRLRNASDRVRAYRTNPQGQQPQPTPSPALPSPAGPTSQPAFPAAPIYDVPTNPFPQPPERPSPPAPWPPSLPAATPSAPGPFSARVPTTPPMQRGDNPVR